MVGGEKFLRRPFFFTKIGKTALQGTLRSRKKLLLEVPDG